MRRLALTYPERKIRGGMPVVRRRWNLLGHACMDAWPSREEPALHEPAVACAWHGLGGLCQRRPLAAHAFDVARHGAERTRGGATCQRRHAFRPAEPPH